MPDEYGNFLYLYEPLRRNAEEVKAAANFGSSSSMYGYGGGFSFADRSQDYSRTDPSTSSIVASCLNWITRNFGQARFECVNYQNDEQTPLESHPLTELLATPNTWYSAQRLWSATLADYNISGNAYWLKERASISARPRALWYVPSFALQPAWPQDREDVYISHYEYTSGRGARVRIDVEDVIHFRHGLDPRNQRLGLSPLRALLLEVFTDLEAGKFTAALLANYGVPGVIVTPGENVKLDKEKAEHFQQLWQRKFSGDGRGRTVFLNYQATVQMLGFNPEQMNLAALRSIPEFRISGALGIPAIIAGLGAGVSSMTKNDFEHAQAFAFEQNLSPTWTTMAEEITSQLLIDFDRRPSVKAHFETKHIKALQESEDAKQLRARENFRYGITTLNEAREAVGLKADPAGDYYLQPGQGTPQLPAHAMETIEGEIIEDEELPAPRQLPPAKTNGLPSNGHAPPKNGHHRKVTPPPAVKLYQHEGLELRRAPTPAEARAVKGVSDAQEQHAASVTKVLMDVRARMLTEAVTELSALTPATYYKLVIDPVTGEFKRLKRALVESYNAGRSLVARELVGGGARSVDVLALPDGVKAFDEDDEALDTLADATLSRVTNDLQSRAIGLISKLVTLGVRGPELTRRLREDIDKLSVAPQEQAASAAANKALMEGRRDEAEARSGEWNRVQFSAILDRNVCESCESFDGEEAATPEELPSDAPSPYCSGGTACRCFHVFIAT